MSKVGFYYDEAGLSHLLRHDPDLQKLEQDIMMQRLDEVRASFLQNFGTEGTFELWVVSTGGGMNKRPRTAFRISAADAKTGAILKRHPGWLGQFMR